MRSASAQGAHIDALNPPELLSATGGRLGERLNDLVDHIGLEAGDVVQKAGREGRVDLFVRQTYPPSFEGRSRSRCGE